MTDDVDIAAMVRLKDGDDLALNEIMERWQFRVTGFLLRMVGDQTVAVDLAQETFVRVYQSNQRYRPTGAFSTWLFSIAANLARQHLRWRRRHPTVSMDDEPEDAIALSEKLTSHEGSPAHDALRKDEAVLVKKAIEELPPDLREAIILFEYHDMSYAEISDVVGCSSKAVETRLYRAKNILREKLSPLV